MAHRVDDFTEGPSVDDSVKACPDCDRPNQFGELCESCSQDRADAYESDRAEWDRTHGF